MKTGRNFENFELANARPEKAPGTSFSKYALKIQLNK